MCYFYASNNTDMILKDRINDIYQNFNLCEDNCDYDKIDKNYYNFWRNIVRFFINDKKYFFKFGHLCYKTYNLILKLFIFLLVNIIKLNYL